MSAFKVDGIHIYNVHAYGVCSDYGTGTLAARLLDFLNNRDKLVSVLKVLNCLHFK
jgi:hypothetical protein